jgi:hypothetical protein
VLSGRTRRCYGALAGTDEVCSAILLGQLLCYRVRQDKPKKIFNKVVLTCTYAHSASLAARPPQTERAPRLARRSIDARSFSLSPQSKHMHPLTALARTASASSDDGLTSDETSPRKDRSFVILATDRSLSEGRLRGEAMLAERIPSADDEIRKVRAQNLKFAAQGLTRTQSDPTNPTLDQKTNSRLFPVLVPVVPDRHDPQTGSSPGGKSPLSRRVRRSVSHGDLAEAASADTIRPYDTAHKPSSFSFALSLSESIRNQNNNAAEMTEEEDERWQASPSPPPQRHLRVRVPSVHEALTSDSAPCTQEGVPIKVFRREAPRCKKGWGLREGEDHFGGELREGEEVFKACFSPQEPARRLGGRTRSV